MNQWGLPKGRMRAGSSSGVQECGEPPRRGTTVWASWCSRSGGCAAACGSRRTRTGASLLLQLLVLAVVQTPDAVRPDGRSVKVSFVVFGQRKAGRRV